MNWLCMTSPNSPCLRCSLAHTNHVPSSGLVATNLPCCILHITLATWTLWPPCVCGDLEQARTLLYCSVYRWVWVCYPSFTICPFVGEAWQRLKAVPCLNSLVPPFAIDTHFLAQRIYYGTLSTFFQDKYTLGLPWMLHTEDHSHTR